MGDIALAALIGGIGLVVGVGVNVAGQLAAGWQTLRREREGRLFDARRAVYANALAWLNHWIVVASGPPAAGEIPRSIDWTEHNVLGAELALLASPSLRPLLSRLATTLIGHAERMAEARTMTPRATLEQIETETTREALIDVKADLERAMLDDLGTQ